MLRQRNCTCHRSHASFDAVTDGASEYAPDFNLASLHASIKAGTETRAQESHQRYSTIVSLRVNSLLMMSQKVKKRSFFVLLFLWTSVMTGTCLEDIQINRATIYVRKHITRDVNNQHAYVVKFSEEQCKQLNNGDIAAALKKDSSQKVNNAFHRQEIYQGTNMVFASFQDIIDNNRKKKRLHAEYRLLYPDATGLSPVQKLLNTAPSAGCVIFYTYLSPCTNTCTLPNGPLNIVDRLPVFEHNNDRSFVFNCVYNREQSKDTVCEALDRIDKLIPVYRCSKKSCLKCFSVNDRNERIQNRNCVSDSDFTIG
ncbi:uncharacterized protein LOC134934684 [Pseudophryne corroboree]|uniref:uncharacterized protein LOC134934684 n=1 Tax=Pseudophryne corroboree TaxID=495146 RepID=UPI003081A5D7